MGPLPLPLSQVGSMPECYSIWLLTFGEVAAVMQLFTPPPTGTGPVGSLHTRDLLVDLHGLPGVVIQIRGQLPRVDAVPLPPWGSGGLLRHDGAWDCRDGHTRAGSNVRLPIEFGGGITVSVPVCKDQPARVLLQLAAWGWRVGLGDLTLHIGKRKLGIGGGFDHFAVQDGCAVRVSWPLRSGAAPFLSPTA